MKARMTLPNSVSVTLEGGADEVRSVLEKLGARGHEASTQSSPRSKAVHSNQTAGPDLADVVRAIKESDEFESIERHVLDKPRQLERVLLALYVLDGVTGGEAGLTSGEISRVCGELGVPISQPNASGVLSGSGARFVIGNRTRTKGQAVRYRLSRRGAQHLEAVLTHQ